MFTDDHAGCRGEVLVLHVCPADDFFEPLNLSRPVALLVHLIGGLLAELVEQELTLYKERAQQLDEKVPTRWVFQGENLFMKDKGGSHFKWILECGAFSVAVSRGIKVGLWGQVRFSSEYLWLWNRN